jgi:hypothetical protein
MAHAPAPWTTYWTVDDNGVPVCEISAHEDGAICEIFDSETSKADARLIAAAPQLLEALKRLLSPPPGIFAGGLRSMEEMQARALIAEIEGKPSARETLSRHGLTPPSPAQQDENLRANVAAWPPREEK